MHFEVCDGLIVHWLHLYGEDFPEFLSENSTRKRRNSICYNSNDFLPS